MNANKRSRNDTGGHHGLNISDEIVGILQTLVVAILYGVSPSLVKFASDFVPGKGQVAVRAIITAVVILGFLIATRSKFNLTSHKVAPLWLAWYVGALGIGQVFFVIAVVNGGITAGVSALFFLNAAKVVLTFLVKILALKEKVALLPKATVVTMIVISLMIFTAGSGSLTLSPPMLFAMGAGAIEAISSIAMSKLPDEDTKTKRSQLNFLRYAVSAAILLVLLPAIGQPIQFQTTFANPAIVVGLVAICVIGLNQSFIGGLELSAYKKISPVLVNVIITSELIWGVVFSVLLIHDVVNTVQLLGMGLMLATTVAAAYLANKDKKTVAIT
jgi:drug/metabolite transporter (DMT)-like permease